MNDYGFRPGSLFGLVNEKGYLPLDTDIYAPSEPFKGNSCAERSNIVTGCEDRVEQTFDMQQTSMSAIDLRLFFW